jgi:hypothetical protein
VYPSASGDWATFSDAASGDQTIYLDEDVSISHVYMPGTAAGNYTITTGAGADEHTLTFSSSNLRQEAAAYALTFDVPVHKSDTASDVYLRPTGTMAFDRPYRDGETGQTRLRGPGMLAFNADTTATYGVSAAYYESDGATLILGAEQALGSGWIYMGSEIQALNVHLTADCTLSTWNSLYLDEYNGAMYIRVHEGDADRTLTLTHFYPLADHGKIVLAPAADGGAGSITLRSVYDGTVLCGLDIEVQAGQRLLIEAPDEPAGAANTFSPGALDGDGRISGEGVVEIEAGSTLKTNHGLAPGGSAGTLTIAGGGSLELHSRSIFELDTPGGNSDQVVLSGDASLTLGGTLAVQNLGGLAKGQVFTLFDSQGAGLTDGMFDDLQMPADFEASTVALDGNDVILTIVPEPGCAVLLLAGAAGLLRRRRS